jgi:hypothetical protein
MKISDRFTDYGLIGGFFGLISFTLASLLGFPKSLVALFEAAINGFSRLPANAASPFAALLGALALIAIFATGLVLDLLAASYFRGIEARIFVGHVQRNQQWLGQLAELTTQIGRRWGRRSWGKGAPEHIT